MDTPMIGKVLAYIFRTQDGVKQVLVFEHVGMPEVGIEVPAGTIEPGEEPERAVLREVFEEAGLTDMRILQKIGRFSFYHPDKREWHDRHVFELEASGSLPEVWTHRVTAPGDEQGLDFRCFWMDVAKAQAELVGSQGIYLQYVGEMQS